MTFLLVTLLTFALIVTLIGFILTTKSNVRTQVPEFTLAPSSRRVVDPVPLRGRRVVDAVPIGGRSVIDAVPPGRRYIDRSLPVARRHVVDSVPVRTSHLSIGSEFQAARYISASAILERIRWRRAADPVPWSVITIGLVSIFILGLYAFNFVLPHHALFSLVWFNQNATAAHPASQPSTYQATQNLVRIGQLDPAQYNTTQEYNLWAYSACSTAAMTEVINAYGHHYRVTDILKVEARIGEITPELGLLEDIGIQRTVAQFGFKTTWGHNLSLDQITTVANQGRPVIVSFPPDRYAGGHLLVVTGGNSKYVYLADSSSWNYHSLSRARFLNWWEGFYAIVTPK